MKYLFMRVFNLKIQEVFESFSSEISQIYYEYGCYQFSKINAVRSGFQELIMHEVIVLLIDLTYVDSQENCIEVEKKIDILLKI